MIIDKQLYAAKSKNLSIICCTCCGVYLMYFSLFFVKGRWLYLKFRMGILINNHSRKRTPKRFWKLTCCRKSCIWAESVLYFHRSGPASNHHREWSILAAVWTFLPCPCWSPKKRYKITRCFDVCTINSLKIFLWPCSCPYHAFSHPSADQSLPRQWWCGWVPETN